MEVGVGLIPGGGGTKELTLRVSDALSEGDPELNRLQEAFMNIATAKVATSAEEARAMHILRPQDEITMNRKRLLTDAKAKVLELYEQGYTEPTQRVDIKVQGRTGLALFEAGVNGMLWEITYPNTMQKLPRNWLGLCVEETLQLLKKFRSNIY